MQIDVFTPSASSTIAVGNDALGMRDLLQAYGHDVRVYAADSSSSEDDKILPVNCYQETTDSLTSGVLIYHHAVGLAESSQAIHHVQKGSQ